jgi:uncharacterized protein YjbJ (UPF0337 family)
MKVTLRLLPSSLPGVRPGNPCCGGVKRPASGPSQEPRMGLACFASTNHTGNKGGPAMNWNEIEGNWRQLKGEAKRQWGELTDDELDQIDGNRERLAGIIQEKYGKSKEEVDRELEEWAGKR